MAEHVLNRADGYAVLLPTGRTGLAEPVQVNVFANRVSRARYFHFSLGFIFPFRDSCLAVAAIQTGAMGDAL